MNDVSHTNKRQHPHDFEKDSEFKKSYNPNRGKEQGPNSRNKNDLDGGLYEGIFLYKPGV